MKLNTLLNLVIRHNEFACLDPKDSQDVEVLLALESYPEFKEACHIYHLPNGLLKLYRRADWLKSPEHRAELIATMEVSKKEFSDRQENWQRAFNALKSKYGVDKAYVILGQVEQGEFPQLKAKFNL